MLSKLEMGGGGEERNLPAQSLNVDISIIVTAITLKFHDFS